MAVPDLEAVATFGIFSTLNTASDELAAHVCSLGYLSIVYEAEEVRRIPNIPSIPSIPTLARLVVW